MTKPTPVQPEGQQDQALVAKGLRMMLEGMLGDLRSGNEQRRLRALLALAGITKKRGGGAVAALQDEFRAADGFEALVTIISAATGPYREESLLVANAVDALVLLTRGNKESIDAAIEAGAMGQLVALVGSGDEAPISINVLKGMRVLMAGSSRAAVHRSVMDAGGVGALIRILDTVMLRAREPDCSIWACEVAGLLYELIRNNPCVSSFLCSSGVVRSTIKILSVCEDPLCLSLGLDILEEIVNSEDRTIIRTAMMAEGAVPALLRMMHIKGIGSKAALALAFMGEDPLHMPVLISILDIEDMACLCQITALAADASDLDAGCCIEFIQLLISSGSLHVLRCLIMARCLGVCLALAPLQACILQLLTDPTTLAEICMLLDNASTYGRLESSLATLELLVTGSQGVRPASFFPACCSIMCRNGKIEAVVEVILDEADAAGGTTPSQHDKLDNDVTVLLAELMRAIPAPSRSEAATLLGSSPAATSAPLGRSPLTYNPPGSQPSKPSLGAGFSREDVNVKRYDSAIFLVGGREFYALGWVVEQSSKCLQRVLQQQTAAGDVKTPVMVPTIEGIAGDRMYELFAVAVEHAYTGYVAIDPADVLDLWALAACLEMDDLRTHCEDTISNMLDQPGLLEASLEVSYLYRTGNRLRDLCVTHIVQNLMDMYSSGRLAQLSRKNREGLQEGLVNVLGDRFLVGSKRLYGITYQARAG